eukprot:2482436-Rhodomonas_salina.1
MCIRDRRERGREREHAPALPPAAHALSAPSTSPFASSSFARTAHTLPLPLSLTAHRACT